MVGDSTCARLTRNPREFSFLSRHCGRIGAKLLIFKEFGPISAIGQPENNWLSEVSS